MSYLMHKFDDYPDLGPFLALDLVSEMLERLDRELPDTLHYHSASHTREVLAECLLFAATDKLPKREQELLAIAATYHDAGFLIRYASNEILGADLAAAAMAKTGRYTAEEIELVRAMILSTAVEDTPEGPRRRQHAPLAAYLMDADWGSFGREDFFDKCDELIRETHSDAASYLQGSLRFLRCQKWLTPAAQSLRSEGKSRNLADLEARLGQGALKRNASSLL